MLSPVSETLTALPCPACQRLLRLGPELHGCVIRCRSCRNRVAVIAESCCGPHEDSPAGSAPTPAPGIAIGCPQCAAELKLTTKLNGCLIRCRSCQTLVAVAVLPDDGEMLVGDAPPAPLACPRCDRTLQIPPSLAGQQIRCRTCRTHLSVQFGRDGLELLPTAEPPVETSARVPRLVTSVASDTRAAIVRSAVSLWVWWERVRALSAGFLQSRTKQLKAPASPGVAKELPTAAGDTAESASGGLSSPQESAEGKVPDNTQPPPATTWPVPRLSWRQKIRLYDLIDWLPNLLLVGSTVAIVVGVIALVWWYIARPPVIPAARWLPLESQVIHSLQWAELAAGGLSQLPKELPGAFLAERVCLFAKSAELEDRQILRVTAASSPDTDELVVVYQLAEPTKPEAIVNREAFRGWRDSDSVSEWVRGAPVYYIGDRALAFPDPQTIVNGSREQVREVLKRGSGRFRGPLAVLLPAADPSAMSTSVAAGVPQPLLKELLDKSHLPADCVAGTVSSYQYGATLKCRTALHLSRPGAADGLRTAIEASMRDLPSVGRPPYSARHILKAANVTAAGDTVTIELEVPAAKLTADIVAALNRLF